jgi:putative tryptophan/tyrosine transport system substrate-binding protein
MKRRQFIAALGTTAAWPIAGRAQAPALPTIGYLGAESPERFATRLRAFRQGLAETGCQPGRPASTQAGSSTALDRAIFRCSA